MRALRAVQMTFQNAFDLFQQGQLSQAEQLCRKIIDRTPDDVDAIHLLGVIECRNSNTAEGVVLIQKATRLAPDNAVFFASLGNALAQLGLPEEALASLERALAINPDLVQALFNRANILVDRLRFNEALAAYDRTLAVAPDYPQAHFNRGNLLARLQRPAEALTAYNRVLALAPDVVPAIINRSAMLARLNRYEEALTGYDRALALQPDDVEALNNRGDVLGHLKRHHEALACFDRALALDPEYQFSLYNRCTALRDLGRYDDAARAGEKLLALNPDFAFLKGELLHLYMLACDWSRLGQLSESIENDLRAGRNSAEPFGYQAIANTAQNLQRCAEIFAAEKFPPQPPLWANERYANARIRIGYVSGEFRQQATSILMTELFERHDKQRFELFAFDNGWDDGSAIRGRINRAFDEIVDISRLSDKEAAVAIRQRRIDILVNLNGYFGLSRQGIFSHRPSPVQVNYLGFPGTIGAAYIDYILADTIVIPPEDQGCYTENVVYLPDTYQVNDSKRRIAKSTSNRAGCGLPEQGFVFCCFNNNYKITPDIFGVWMHLLKKLDDSVLWLFEHNPVSSRNLRKAAQERGVEPNRLIFAARMNHDEHLARHRLADLFLDTLPYNAHTTASDALWAGLPVLTCQGTTFPGRVAASLLRAAGLPELITDNIEDYEKEATKLALDNQRLSALKNRLANNRENCPLFDTDRFRKNLETAYTIMHDKTQRGEAPCGFAV